jgi:NADH:ubiquinone oxidoreductase subunit 4 (subunit M)
MLDKNSNIIEQKRRGPDIWVKIIHWLAACGWVLMFVVLLLADKARPQVAFFLDRILQIPLRTDWDMHLIGIACFLMIIILFLCTIGLFINSRRHKRRDDRYNRSLVIMWILAFIGVIITVVNL